MMYSVFTPPPPRRRVQVKREPGESLPTQAASQVKAEPGEPPGPQVKVEPIGPEDTPWAMQKVVTQPTRTQAPSVVRVEPVRPPKQEFPWEEEQPRPVQRTRRPREDNRIHPGPARPQQHAPPGWGSQPPTRPEPAEEAGWTTARAAPARGGGDASQQRVCAKNYAAVEHGLDRYGLIDMGAQASGRSLLVHARKRCRPAFSLLNAIRPGTILRARRWGDQALHCLRVRFTTPARYYSPGAQVTTLSVGVDEADWLSLMGTAGGRG
jgi:hypothetical protein